MPEQITKYPEVTIQVLKGGGARCGPGVEKQILKQCPGERFCAFPSGEICVYGIAEIARMTQVRPPEIARVVCPPAQRSGPDPGGLLAADAGSLGLAFALGLAAGAVSLRARGRRPRP
ncbi:MAG TPA: hypothetical protein VNK67_10080 [Burkholderiales bacterium]|nr:hypothetical protein [Burkholderiales bacterium]